MLAFSIYIGGIDESAAYAKNESTQQITAHKIKGLH